MFYYPLQILKDLWSMEIQRLYPALNRKLVCSKWQITIKGSIFRIYNNLVPYKLESDAYSYVFSEKLRNKIIMHYIFFLIFIREWLQTSISLCNYLCCNTQFFISYKGYCQLIQSTKCVESKLDFFILQRGFHLSNEVTN